MALLPEWFTDMISGLQGVDTQEYWDREVRRIVEEQQKKHGGQGRIPRALKSSKSNRERAKREAIDFLKSLTGGGWMGAGGLGGTPVSEEPQLPIRPAREAARVTAATPPSPDDRDIDGVWVGNKYVMDPVRPPAERDRNVAGSPSTDAPIRGFPSLTGYSPDKMYGADWLRQVASGKIEGIDLGPLSEEKIAKIRQQAKDKFGKAAGGGIYAEADASKLGPDQTPEGAERIFGDIERFNDAALGREAQWHLTDRAGDPNKGIAILQSLIEKQRIQAITNQQMLDQARWMANAGDEGRVTEIEAFKSVGDAIDKALSSEAAMTDNEFFADLNMARALLASGDVAGANSAFQTAIGAWRKRLGGNALPTNQSDVNPANRAGARHPAINPMSPQSLGNGVVDVQYGQ